MKWFKHLVASGGDPDIDDAISKFGSDGYYVFFMLLEIMAREFDPKNPGFNHFSISFLSKKFRISWKKTVKVMEYFDKRNRIFCEFSELDGLASVKLNCPKLKELCDEYTQKQIKKLSGQSRDKVEIGVGTKTQTQTQTTETDMLVLTGEPGISNFKGGVYYQEIMKKADTIYELANNSNGNKKINIYAWVNGAVKKNGHPKAIDEGLSNLINRWEKVTSPWPYVESIFQLKNGNYWEDEHVKESQEFNQEWNEQVDVSEMLKGLIDDIGG